MLNYVQVEKLYNADEFLRFIEVESQKTGHGNNRYELIDGYIYMMASPSLTHQRLARFIFEVFASYFKGKNCEVLFAPLDVFLFDKSRFILFPIDSKDSCRNVFQPDIMVVCDKSILEENGVHGAPDLVIEIVSKSSSTLDYVIKLHNYICFGVKEYWIINPLTRQIMIYIVSGEDVLVSNYTFDDAVRSEMFESLCVDFKQFSTE